MTATQPVISVVLPNDASCDDLQMIFGSRGEASRCQCQYVVSGWTRCGFTLSVTSAGT